MVAAILSDDELASLHRLSALWARSMADTLREAVRRALVQAREK
jgi:hypothetical protein